MVKVKLLVTLVILGISISVQSSPDNKVNSSQEKLRSNNETKILFIGNSYTYFNKLPDIFLALAKATGKKAMVKYYTVGGYKFENHKKSVVALNAIKSDKWDYIVLQNQSQISGWKPEDIVSKSVPNAIYLAQLIRDNNANTQIVYFVTWGRKKGDAMNCSYYPKVCDFRGHTEAVRQGYRLYQNSTGGVLADVGQSWLAVIDDQNASDQLKDLWTADNSHPSYRGTYLAANTIYTAIFNESTIGIEFFGKLEKEDALYYQKMASKSHKF